MEASAYTDAAARIAGHVRRTPLVPAAPAGERPNLWFKPECLQVSGSFKARGAFNSVLSIPEEKRANGVVTASGGNFGAAISPSIEAMLAMWEEILGADISILQTEWAIFLQDLHQNRFQMFGGLGWIADYPDPENFLDVLFHSQSDNNQSVNKSCL